ncbi:MAG: S-layer homology domain-containing protein, partial [Leptolyngbyaceae cyanobacterium MO_188.B28]|nr:S-layer homology domain-containing protein [Leptolyngbyaceae cyanobacterium MO_188.B28]
MRFRPPTSRLILLILGLGISVAGCAGGPFGQTLKKSLEADSQLEENPPFGAADESTQTPPADGQTASQATVLTPEQGPNAPLENRASNQDPQSGEPAFIGPVQSSNLAAAPDPMRANNEFLQGAPGFSDLTQTPAELLSYIEDLAILHLLFPADEAEAIDGENTQTQQKRFFKPNQTITRREYARWLTTINNAFHLDNPAEQIRLAVETTQPTFQDVPTSDPDFPQIQGLAEAGIIPSPLSGSTTTVTFRPDSPLTREDLILWKIPLDIRQNLPNADINAVQQTWGFQDAARIDPRALQAVLADFQNGEFANIRRAFGYTMLFQPDKAVTRAEAAAVLWRFGNQT